MFNAVDQIPIALGQIQFARNYVMTLLQDLEPAEWFTIPTGAVTHIAWQVGHMAMAEYGLCLFRVRGRQPIDLELMPSKFRKQFSKGSIPDPVAENHLPPAELLATVQKIHEQVLLELPTFTNEQLLEPSDMPYAVHANKLGAILFAPMHEMLHAGQIGLLRRLMGKSPIR
jgi:DinB superfamily